MMKKAKKYAVAILLLITFTLMGCVTTSSEDMEHFEGPFFRKVPTPPMKDFEAKGLVFTEVQLVTTNSSTTGKMLTYQELLKEAKKVGADAIINVVIDKQTGIVSSGSDSTMTETWYGSALAIKYTTALKAEYMNAETRYSFSELNVVVPNK